MKKNSKNDSPFSLFQELLEDATHTSQDVTKLMKAGFNSSSAEHIVKCGKEGYTLCKTESLAHPIDVVILANPTINNSHIAFWPNGSITYGTIEQINAVHP